MGRYRNNCLAIFGILAAMMAVGAPEPSRAAVGCGAEQILSTYRAGLAELQAKNLGRARVRWEALAQAGFAPAQRRMAELYATGNGVDRSRTAAAFWAMLSAQGYDAAAAKLAGQLRSKLRAGELHAVEARVKAWRSGRPVCKFGKVRIAKPGAPDPSRAKSVPELEKAIAFAANNIPGGRLYFLAVDSFEIFQAERFTRYVGWNPKQPCYVLKLADSNFLDKAPDFLADAIIRVTRRRLYDALPDSTLADPILRTRRGIKLIGTVYPDIRNDQFFKFVERAFEMAKVLPKSLQRYIDIIDEIHYNPQSKHFIKRGTVDASGAYYNNSLSSDEHRMMFIRQDVLFSSPLFFLRSIIHEGTHAVQDAQAERFNHEVPRERVALQRLTNAGNGNSAESKKLRASIDKNLDYVIRRFRGIETERGFIQDIKFECEATRNEIRLLRAIVGSPDMMNNSGYVKLCPSAQRMLVDWRNERWKNRRR